MLRAEAALGGPGSLANDGTRLEVSGFRVSVSSLSSTSQLPVIEYSIGFTRTSDETNLTLYNSTTIRGPTTQPCMNTQFPSRIRSRRQGIALILVVIVMAMAAILGYAMLSASAVQATASSNAVAAATARAQAESGIHWRCITCSMNNAPSAGFTWSNVTFATTQPAATIPAA